MPALKEISTGRMNTFTYRVPAGSQSTFLRTMAKNMGWELVPQPRKRKTHTPNATTIRAIRDVEAGKVFHTESVEDLIAQLNRMTLTTPDNSSATTN